VRGLAPAGQHVVQARRDVAVVVEAENLGFRERIGELAAIALGQAARRDDLGPGPGRAEQFVDGLLLGGLDEAASVDHDDARVLAVGGDFPAARGQTAGQLLRIDLVPGAAERDQADGAADRAVVTGYGRTRRARGPAG